MKKFFYGLLALVAVAAYADGAGQDVLGALQETHFNLDARAFYFNRDFSAPAGQSEAPGREAFALGGIAKATTGEFYGGRLSAAYYGSFRMFTDQDRGAGTFILEQGTGDNISFVGELNYQQSLGQSTFTVGRQRLNTPLANDHDLRLLPTTFEAAVLDIAELENTRVQLGYIHKFTQLGSRLNEFKTVPSWTDSGLAYVYLEDKSINNAVLRAQYAKALGSEGSKSTSLVKDYRYADVSYRLPTELKTTLKAQAGGNDYAQGRNSMMLGAALEVAWDSVALGAVSNIIKHNDFKAIESGPMFTDWQQGYNDYGPSAAWGGYLALTPIAGVSAKLGSVKVSSRESINKEDFIESIADFWYTVNKHHKFRLRYSYKDHTHVSQRNDSQDFRLAYYLSF